MNTTVIITKKAGQDIPRGYLQVALKECPSCYGISIQDKDGDQPLLDIVAEPKEIPLDKLVETVQSCKDLSLMIVLGNMTQDFDKESDLMPFVFQQSVEGEDDPQNILAIAFEGDFPNYSKPEAGHTDEFNLWEDFVYPTILEKFEASPDLDAFYARLRTSAFEQSIMNTVSHRGVAAIMPLYGELIAFGRNELGGEFDWGTTSNRFKWGDPTVVEKVSSAVSKGRGRLATIIGGSAVEIKDPPGVHRVGGTTIVDKEAQKGSTAVKAPANATVLAPPSKLQGNARNAWIRLFTNNPTESLPSNHQHKDFTIAIPNNILSFAQRDVATRDDVRKLASEVKSFLADGTVKPATDPVSAGMKEAHKEASKANEEKATVKPLDYLPELTAEDKLGTVGLVVDWATRPKSPSHLEIQKIESKWPVFSTMMGIRFEDMLKWTMKDIKLLGKKYPDALGLAFVEMRRYAIEHSDQTLGDLVTPEKVEPKAPDKQVTVPPAQPAGTPPKKSRLAAITGKAA